MPTRSTADFGQKWMAENDAGSGPFKLRRFAGTSLIHMDTVPTTGRAGPWRKRSASLGVIYRIIRESAPRKSAFQRKEADVIANVTPDDYGQLERLPGIKMHSYPGFTTFGIKLNCQVGPTADVNMRKAIAYAFDYDSLLTVLNGMGPCSRVPSRGNHRHIDVPDMPRRNLDKARVPEEDGPSERRHRARILLQQRRRGRPAHRPVGAGFAARDRHQGEHRGPALATMLAGRASPRRRRRCSRSMPRRPAPIPIRSPSGITRRPGPLQRQLLRRPPRLEADRGGPQRDGCGAADGDVRRDPARRRRRPARDLRHDANRIWGMRDYVKGFDYCPVRATHEVDFYPMWVD